MMVSLSTVASVRSGYPFRSGINHDPDGDVTVIQMRDINYDTHQLNNSGELYRVSGYEPKNEHWLAEGDILFVSKGVNKIAVHLDQMPVQAIAAPTFFVLRSTSDRLLSTYLAWYLNSGSVQQRFRELARGSVIPIITKQMLDELEIPLPVIEKQRSIVEIDRLTATERQLITMIQEKRALLIESYLYNHN